MEANTGAGQNRTSKRSGTTRENIFVKVKVEGTKE
jgi:hypothetical protein